MAATFSYYDSSKGAVGTVQPSNIRAEALLQGRNAVVMGQIQFDSSYPTGGYPASKFGLKTFVGVNFTHPPGYIIAYNSSTDKVQVYDQGASAGVFAEAAAATNLSAVQPVGFFAFGTW